MGRPWCNYESGRELTTLERDNIMYAKIKDLEEDLAVLRRLVRRSEATSYTPRVVRGFRWWCFWKTA